MTMSFLLHESLSDFDTSGLGDPVRTSPGRRLPASKDGPTIIAGQLCPPEIGSIVHRTRLIDLLGRSGSQFGATLISGRAGTGKTVLAADFATGHRHVAWYSVESADSRWEVFSSYFFASLCGRSSRRPKALVSLPDEAIDDAAAAEFLKHCFARIERNCKGRPSLIVLENIHHLFDAEWFSRFFNQLIFSLIPGVQLLMTCRSKPPAPLWRLRSKQMLNVIDESMLEFSPSEALELCALQKLPQDAATDAYRRSAGRISKLIESLEESADRA